MPNRDNKTDVSRAAASTFDADMRERLLGGHPIREGAYREPAEIKQIFGYKPKSNIETDFYA